MLIAKKEQNYASRCAAECGGTHILETKLVLVPSDFRQPDEVT